MYMPIVRQSFVERNTSETQIRLALQLTEGEPGSLAGSCGIGFLDHMLRAVCVHGGMEIELTMKGDLEVELPSFRRGPGHRLRAGVPAGGGG